MIKTQPLFRFNLKTKCKAKLSAALHFVYFDLSPHTAHIVAIGLSVPVAVAIVEILFPTQLLGRLRRRPIVA